MFIQAAQIQSNPIQSNSYKLPQIQARTQEMLNLNI
jgi:hypothetical protein